MRLDYLKMFCDVARCRSFSEAAHLHNVSQSAASQVVLQIEKRLGVQLFDRSTRPLQLTSEGRAYYDGCRGLIAQYETLEASIRKIHDRVSGTVQVAAIYSVGLRDMNQYIHKFTDAWSDSTVHIEYLHPHRVYEKVLDGTADFGLVSYPRKSRELVAIRWREEEMFLACAPTHPLAAHKNGVRISDLRGVQYVGFDRDLTIRRHTDRFLKEHQVSVEIVLEFDNIENVKKAIQESVGVALLPEPMLRQEASNGLLVALPLIDAHLTRPLGIIYKRHHVLSRAALDFMQMLREPDTPALNSGSISRKANEPATTNGTPVRGRDRSR